MNAIWSEARAKVSHRLAMHLQVDPLSAAQCHADGQLHLRRPAEERGDHRRRHPGSARRARDVLCIGRPGRCHDAPDGRPATPATCCRCIAAATRSAATPSRTSAPATSTRRRWPRKSRATAIIFASLDPAIDRDLRLPVRLRFVRAQAAAQGRIPDLPQHRAGRKRRQVDLQFLRAMPLIDRADGSRRDRPRIRRGANQ